MQPNGCISRRRARPVGRAVGSPAPARRDPGRPHRYRVGAGPAADILAEIGASPLIWRLHDSIHRDEQRRDDLSHDDLLKIRGAWWSLDRPLLTQRTGGGRIDRSGSLISLSLLPA